MAWLSPFLLGRPGYEYEFEVNPESIQITDAPLVVLHRNLAGDTKKSVFKSFLPTVRIASSYLSVDQRNKFASLAGIADTFLSFRTRDDWQVVAQKNLSTDSSHVTIQNNSITRLSTILVAGGFPGIVTIDSVTVIPSTVGGVLFGSGGFGEGGFSGPDYYTGGSYDDATRTITLGTSLPSTQQYVYVTYTYTGWLVNMEALQHSAVGGWVDRFQYDFTLTGA